MKKAVVTENAPKAIGPYSQAISDGTYLFCSGQIPLVPGTGKLVQGGIESQAIQVLTNLKAVIEAAGSSMAGVVKTTILLADMEDFKTVNSVYASFFEEPFPARATFQVARLPMDARVEIEAICKLR